MKLQVGAVWWTVELVDPIHMGNNEGECLDEACLIRINKAQAPERILETLTHELLHACWSESGLGSDSHGEERVVGALNPLWLGLWRNYGVDILGFPSRVESGEVG